MRTTPSHNQEKILVFLVPTHKRRAAMDSCHCFARHQGQDRTVSLIKECFWWPNMMQDTMKSIWKCAQCMQFKWRVQKPQLEPIICTDGLGPY